VNNLKVFMLLAGMVALFGVVGGMLGGQNGMLLALVIAAAMSGFMYFNSGRMALRAYRAQVVTREQAPEIHEIVDRLRQRAGLPMPQVAIAHEIGHIKNRDMLLQTLSATMAGAITNLARFGMYAPSEGRRGSPLAPLAAFDAISRHFRQRGANDEPGTSMADEFSRACTRRWQRPGRGLVHG